MKKNTECCRVCGEKTAGWHCGTVTCEACKKFFLRMIQNPPDKDFKCTRQIENCVITKTTRVNCAFCRFKKCLQVGMDKNATSDPNVPFSNYPCLVCGDESSGVHFGVISCEGCKGFFRRNIKDKKKHVCLTKGKCEMSFKTRNICRACRLNRCLEVGMNPNNSKIGRQSNLFKQKLRSQIKGNEESLGASHSDLFISSSNVSLNSGFKLNDSVESTNNSLVNIEDTLDLETGKIIRNVYYHFNHLENVPENMFFHNFQDYQVPFELICLHTQNCFNFLSNIGYFFGNNDRQMMVINSIHSIRAVQIARQSKYGNYFNCDDHSFNKIVKLYPFFEKINPYLKNLIESLREIRLDNKEYALFMALVAFSSSCRGVSNLKYIYSCNLELCKALTKYMHFRRNESESCEQLINLSFRFEKLNLYIQKCLHEKCNELEKLGYAFERYKFLFNNFC